MNKCITSLLFLFFLFISNGLAFAQDHSEVDSHEMVEHTKGGAEEEFNAKEMIMTHINDSNEWHVATLNEGTPEEKHLSIPLPVIIKDNDGLHTFMSSKIAHGHEHDGYTMDHGIVVSTKGLQRASLFGVIKGDQNSDNAFYDFSITKNVAALFFSVIFILLVFIGMARSYSSSLVPKGVAKFMEPFVLFIRDEIAIPNIGASKYKKFMPYLLTIFFFVWINNMIGLIPFFPFSANLTGNIYFTFVLAIITFIITTLNGNKDYWGHVFSPPVPKVLYPIMWPIEIIGMFTKPFALMIRLFANITAGHIIIISLFSLIYIFKTVWISPVSGAFVLFMSFLEMLVAALQAYVFTLLSALFIGQAVEEHDHH